MKEALKLAGDVAIKARRVIDATSKTLSWRVSELELALDEYDRYIIEMTRKSKIG